MIRRAINYLAAFCILTVLSSCQTTTSEKSNYSLAEGRGDSILDSRIKKLEEEAIKYPMRADLHFEIASLHAKKGDCRESARALEKAISLSPEEAKYHFHLGRLFLSMSDLSSAEREFREAVRMTRGDRYTGPHAALAWTLSLKKDLDGALGEFNHCVKIDPANPVYYYFIGSIHDMKGDREKAIHNFREYLARGGTAYQKKATDILMALGVNRGDIPDPAKEARNEDLFAPEIMERGEAGDAKPQKS